MTTITTTTVDVEALRERAIRLGVESAKAHRAGKHEAPVVEMAFDAITEALDAGGNQLGIAGEIDLRYATYLLNTLQSGFEESCAFDGDLDHPEGAGGEKIDLTGATA